MEFLGCAMFAFGTLGAIGGGMLGMLAAFLILVFLSVHTSAFNRDGGELCFNRWTTHLGYFFLKFKHFLVKAWFTLVR